MSEGRMAEVTIGVPFIVKRGDGYNPQRCPDCHGRKTTTKTVRAVNPTNREVTYSCNECGCEYRVHLQSIPSNVRVRG